ncbi:MAG: hypothetical protein RIS70_1701 [Planctomycetota bacterium]
MDPISFARLLRSTANSYELLLWHLLRNRQIANAKFRRQHPLGKYIADFYCLEAKLVIEIDGKDHFTPAGRRHDAIRDRWMTEQGIRVLRFTGKQMELETESVLKAIKAALRVSN